MKFLSWAPWLFVAFFSLSLYLTWQAYRDIQNQEKRNREILVERIQDESQEIEQRLQEALSIFEKQKPKTVGDCLRFKQVVFSDGLSLPVSGFWSIEKVSGLLEGDRLSSHVREELENEISGIDPYVCRHLIVAMSKDGNVMTQAGLERLLELSEEIDDREGLFFDLGKSVFVNRQSGRLQMGLMPPECLRTQDSFFEMNNQAQLPFFQTNLSDQTAMWQLTPEGERFLKQSGSLRGVLLSGSLAVGVFLYGIFFFTRSQNNLRHQNKMREQLVADISHELRTPVTTLRMYAEMLRDGRVQDEDKKNQYYDSLVGESKRLNRLIDNILDFSRLEQGRLKLNLTPVSVTALADQVKDAVTFVDVDKRLEFVSTDTPQGNLLINSEACVQAIYNVITNALKYSEGSKVRVVWGADVSDADDRHVAVTVSDQGPGIPPDERAHIFEPFFRGQRAHSGQQQGSGLGLGIAKELMLAMGGDVVLQSDRVETTFVFTLPKEEVA